MKNTLTRTENKNGTFTYTAMNESGKVLATRTSKNGKYIACSPSGNYYFSRLDLIGKGDSGRYFDMFPGTREEVAYLQTK